MADRGVVFDVDGRLVDSNQAHAQAWAEALRAHGIPRDAAACNCPLSAPHVSSMFQVCGGD
jgi:beta-phosphoglucomutase-like phosphatase (HAD superfamily)